MEDMVKKDNNSERVIHNGFYRHFKGRIYYVIGIAEHTETGERMVVYRAMYGEHKLYVRPYDMFAGRVATTQKYRFVECYSKRVGKNNL